MTDDNTEVEFSRKVSKYNSKIVSFNLPDNYDIRSAIRKHHNDIPRTSL